MSQCLMLHEKHVLHGLARRDSSGRQTTGAEYFWENVYGCTNEVEQRPQPRFISCKHMSRQLVLWILSFLKFRRFWWNYNCLPNASQFYLFIIFTYLVISAQLYWYSNTSSTGKWMLLLLSVRRGTLSRVSVCVCVFAQAPYSYFV